MKILGIASVAGALALGLAAGSARADVVTFDEFASPPVTGFYADTGVVGPRAYAHVTIQDGDGSGFVMNGDGWLDQQTSGFNLFGTESGAMDFLFAAAVSGFNFDLINGVGASTFTVRLFDVANTEIGMHDFDLADFGEIGSVSHLSFSETGVTHATLVGDSDFAIDTVGFSSAAPEPVTWALMIGGLGLAGTALRRRRSLAAAG